MELIDRMAASRGIDPDLDLRIHPLALVDLRDDFEAQTAEGASEPSSGGGRKLIHVVRAPASFTHPHSLAELAACAPQVRIIVQGDKCKQTLLLTLGCSAILLGQ